MKNLLKISVKILIKSAIETLWGMIGTIALLIMIGKVNEFIERRRSQKDK